MWNTFDLLFLNTEQGSPHEAKIFEPVESDDVRSALANIEDIGFLSLQTPERDHGTSKIENKIKIE